MAEKTLEQRVADLERMIPLQLRAVSRINDQETAAIKADIGTLRVQMLAGFASIETRLDSVETRLDGRMDSFSRDVAEIKQTLDALPRVLAEELTKRRQ